MNRIDCYKFKDDGKDCNCTSGIVLVQYISTAKGIRMERSGTGPFAPELVFSSVEQ